MDVVVCSLFRTYPSGKEKGMLELELKLESIQRKIDTRTNRMVFYGVILLILVFPEFLTRGTANTVAIVVLSLDIATGFALVLFRLYWSVQFKEEIKRRKE